jgi:predicted nuclease of predicted toxin-antitoxin system
VRFLADENFPLPSIRMLTAAGHDIAAIALESPGAPDETVLERAFREERILLAFDRDYGGLLYLRGAQPPEGIVYFCFSPSSPQEPAEYLLGLIERFGSSLSGTLTVAERNRLRKRPLPGADLP